MRQIEDRYISLLTDFGFKRIFGTVPNKELLICFLNSLFDGKQVVKDVKLCDTLTHKVFYEKLDFIYVEIAKFDKPEDELVTLYDKWLYVLKNLSRLDQRQKALRDKVFDRLFEEAEIARFTPRELREYEDSRKAYRDLKNSLDTALRQGHAEGHAEGLAEGLVQGREEGLLQTAKNLKAMGLSDTDIQRATGLSMKVIAAL